jgi:uncharacterized protein YjiS (DUF1127 family)
MTTCNPTIRQPSLMQRIVQSIADGARRVVEAVSNGYRRRQLIGELEMLDDRTLRDLGLQRSELGSVVAELMDDKPATRRRAHGNTARHRRNAAWLPAASE